MLSEQLRIQEQPDNYFFTKFMSKDLSLEFVRVTEAAAIDAAKWMGKGQAKKADGAAVKAMRSRFNVVDFSGQVVIGEGQKDKAPELYIGEKVGTGKGSKFDLAVDPLECTDSVAHGRYNAISVISSGPKGTLFHAPDTYMDQIAVGPKAAKVIDLDKPVEENIKATAKALGVKVQELTTIILDRERHDDLIKRVRKVGARVRLITDGTVAGGIAACFPESGIDIMLGIGGSSEAVLTAVALKCLGGNLQARFQPPNQDHVKRIKKMGITDLDKKFEMKDLAKGNDLTFTATGIIDGPLLKGVNFIPTGAKTHSVVMRVKTKTVRFIEATHTF